MQLWIIGYHFPNIRLSRAPCAVMWGQCWPFQQFHLMPDALGKHGAFTSPLTLWTLHALSFRWLHLLVSHTNHVSFVLDQRPFCLWYLWAGRYGYMYGLKFFCCKFCRPSLSKTPELVRTVNYIYHLLQDQAIRVCNLQSMVVTQFKTALVSLMII